MKTHSNAVILELHGRAGIANFVQLYNGGALTETHISKPARENHRKRKKVDTNRELDKIKSKGQKNKWGADGKWCALQGQKCTLHLKTQRTCAS